MKMSDDRVCMHYVIEQLDEWLDRAVTVTGKVSDVEYVRTDDIKKFKNELIFNHWHTKNNVGVNQRIAWHEDE